MSHTTKPKVVGHRLDGQAAVVAVGMQVRWHTLAELWEVSAAARVPRDVLLSGVKDCLGRSHILLVKHSFALVRWDSIWPVVRSYSWRKVNSAVSCWTVVLDRFDEFQAEGAHSLACVLAVLDSTDLADSILPHKDLAVVVECIAHNRLALLVLQSTAVAVECTAERCTQGTERAKSYQIYPVSVAAVGSLPVRHSVNPGLSVVGGA